MYLPTDVINPTYDVLHIPKPSHPFSPLITERSRSRAEELLPSVATSERAEILRTSETT